MASVSKRPTGAYTVLFYWDKPYQTKIHLKTKVKREAERVADHIQSLVDSRKAGVPFSHEVELWLSRLNEVDSNLYNKLSAFGLVKSKEKPKSIRELYELFLQQETKKDTTNDRYKQVAITLFTLLGGEDRLVNTITTEDATRAMVDLKTLALNRRSKNPQVYAPTTIARATIRIKTMFSFAEKLGWVSKSPFRFCKGGTQVNYSKWRYIPRSSVLKVLEHCDNPKWRAIIALGRFAGCRGASEMFNLTWDRVNFETNIIVLHATKKEAFDDAERGVPMNSVLVQALLLLKEAQGTSGATHLFPGMGEHDNTSTMTGKKFVSAGFESGPEPWYNLRRSFCSDVMESGVDPKMYEAICGHSFETGMRHYQILHPERKIRGMNLVREMMERLSDDVD